MLAWCVEWLRRGSHGLALVRTLLVVSGLGLGALVVTDQLVPVLDRSPTARSWTLDDADAWWMRHERSTAAPSSVSTPAAAAGEAPAAGNGAAATPPIGARTATSGFDQTIASGQHDH